MKINKRKCLLFLIIMLNRVYKDGVKFVYYENGKF